jgi:hypothetical protein
MRFGGRQRADLIDPYWSIYLCLTEAFTLPDNFRLEFPGPVFAHSTVESANGCVVACKETEFT